MTHFVSLSCQDERCHCGTPASHKVGEEIPRDQPCPNCGVYDGPAAGTCKWHVPGPQARHELTAYVCCEHFTELFGPATGCPVEPVASRVDGPLDMPAIIELHGKRWTLLQRAYVDDATGVHGYFALEQVEGGGVKLPAVVQYVETKGPAT